MNGLKAELLIVGKRTSTSVLLGVMLVMTVVFAYVLPYATYLSNPAAPGAADDLQLLLPHQIVPALVEGMPFYLGMVSLVLGAMALGSEFNWKTVKTMLLQTSDRAGVVLAKFGALLAVTALFSLAVFVAGAACSLLVAVYEGEAIVAPPLLEVFEGLAASWIILSLWAVFGGLLATLARGTAMAIGLGILYGFLVEGLLGRFVTSIDGIGNVAYVFLRTNAYSLIQGFGIRPESSGEPGAFAGPFVDPLVGLVVIVLYIAAFIAVTAVLFTRRDVA